MTEQQSFWERMQATVTRQIVWVTIYKHHDCCERDGETVERVDAVVNGVIAVPHQQPQCGQLGVELWRESRTRMTRDEWRADKLYRWEPK